ncbi:MAG: hypothetical protein HYZ75_04675 [Elusimicrobia bacterium]|nr:hypothetical protein [Elusimicrobiota bacterium]
MSLSLALCLLLSLSAVAEASPSAHETVILLHGMGRTRLSMLVLAWRLRRAGFRTISFPYNHAIDTLPEISGQLKGLIAKEARGGRYHLVGHSLGNIIIREGFRDGYSEGLGRIVMLAPPNGPARMAAKLKENLLYSWITGDSGQKLSSVEFYAGLPVPDVEFAVIAGERGTSLLSKNPNDGIILAETTKLDGMKSFALLRKTHTFIMNSAETARLTALFLREGRFLAPD